MFIESIPTSAGPGLYEPVSGALGEMRMSFEVRVRPPMLVPSRLEEHRPSANVARAERHFIDGRPARRVDAHDETFKIRNRLEWKLGQVLSVLVAMKWAVDIGAGVADHLDLADLEIVARRIALARLFATHPVADERRGQALVGNHAVFNGVADVDEPFHDCS